MDEKTSPSFANGMSTSPTAELSSISSSAPSLNASTSEISSISSFPTYIRDSTPISSIPYVYSQVDHLMYTYPYNHLYPNMFHNPCVVEPHDSCESYDLAHMTATEQSWVSMSSNGQYLNSSAPVGSKPSAADAECCARYVYGTRNNSDYERDNYQFNTGPSNNRGMPRRRGMRNRISQNVSNEKSSTNSRTRNCDVPWQNQHLANKNQDTTVSKNVTKAAGQSNRNKQYNYHKFQNFNNRSVFRKERFIQASFRIYLESKELLLFFIQNPDEYIDWKSVRCVDLYSDKKMECPICLEEMMVAPHITKCGHVFCLHCILRYLNVKEKDSRYWRRCPLCAESVTKNDLRSVNIEMVLPLAVGKLIDLCLIHRSRDWTLHLPTTWTSYLKCDTKYTTVFDDSERVPNYNDLGCQFSRLCVVSARHMQGIKRNEYASISNEIETALSNYNEDGFYSEALYEAQSIVRDQSDNVETHTSESDNNFDKVAIESSALSAVKHEMTEMYIKNHEDNFTTRGYWDNNDCEISPENRFTNNNKVDKEPYIYLPSTYLYQSYNGQNVYLHPDAMRYLIWDHKMRYKSRTGSRIDKLEPHRYLPMMLMDLEIASIDRMSLNEELRKRYQFLKHLPLSTEIVFVRPNMPRWMYILPHTLHMFRHSIKETQRQIEEKERREIEMENTPKLNRQSVSQTWHVNMEKAPINVPKEDMIFEFPPLLESSQSVSDWVNDATVDESYLRYVSQSNGISELKTQFVNETHVIENKQSDLDQTLQTDLPNIDTFDSEASIVNTLISDISTPDSTVRHSLSSQVSSSAALHIPPIPVPSSSSSCSSSANVGVSTPTPKSSFMDMVKRQRDADNAAREKERVAGNKKSSFDEEFPPLI